jgi:hypothetical protein
MKKILFFVVSFILVNLFASCELYEEQAELMGNGKNPTDTVTVEKTDTVTVETVVNDTVFVQDTIVLNDTIVVGDTIVIEPVVATPTCWELAHQGYVWINFDDGTRRLSSHNIGISTTPRIELNADGCVKLNTIPCKVAQPRTQYAYAVGANNVNVDIIVTGLGTILVNGYEVEQCSDITVCVELEDLESSSDETRTSCLTQAEYTIHNDNNEIVAMQKQQLYCWYEYPEQGGGEDDPKPEPENERHVNIEYEFDNDVLVVKGNIDNTIWPDTNAIVRVPLMVTIETQEPKTVFGNGFDFSVMPNGATEKSKTAIRTGLQKNNNTMTVTYNEYEAIYAHNCSASGTVITNNQTVRYYGEFVINFGGRQEVVSAPINVIASSYNEGGIYTDLEAAAKDYNVTYTANYASLTASAEQKLTIKVNAINFDGNVVFANRSVSFSDIKNPRVFDCVVTENGGVYEFHYREIVSQKPQAWVARTLTAEEYSYIAKGMAQAKSALAVYFDAQDKAHPGYVLDYLKEAKQSLYYAYGYPEDTHDSVNEAMFGYLHKAILGKGVVKDGLVEMVCEEGVWEFKNQKTTLSNKETVWFVK